MLEDKVIRTRFFDRDFVFFATYGLFSPTEIDEGTALLLNQIKLKPEARILDLGCGYGALGIILGTACHSKIVHMVDKDFVAIEYAQKNVKQNKIEAEVYLSNGFSHVPKGELFDLIVSNIPAKVGNELLHQFLEDTKKHLAPDGEMWIVTINGLRQYMKREMTEVFGNAKKVKQSVHYTITKATKES